MTSEPELLDVDGGPDEEDPEYNPDPSADAPPFGDDDEDDEPEE